MRKNFLCAGIENLFSSPNSKILYIAEDNGNEHAYAMSLFNRCELKDKKYEIDLTTMGFLNTGCQEIGCQEGGKPILCEKNKITLKIDKDHYSMGENHVTLFGKVSSKSILNDPSLHYKANHAYVLITQRV